MSPPDQLIDEKHKTKSKHREEPVKLSQRFKVRRDKVTKNSDAQNDSSSIIHRCKKFVSFKRYSAQDRLKRIRANLDLDLQTKIIDQVCSKPNTNIFNPNKNSAPLNKKCIQNNDGEIKKCKIETSSKVKYSADSRLKKIRAAIEKKILNRKQVDLKSVTNIDDQAEKTIGSISSNDVHHGQKSICEEQKLERQNSGYSMDVDLELDASTENNEVTRDTSHLETILEESSIFPPGQVSFITDEICKFRRDRAYLALHECFTPDFIMNLAVPVGDVFIVIDTNIFLSHLSFVKTLLTNDIPPYKSPIIVIPWLVLQEIDYATKKNDVKLSSRAKAANIFIYECLKKKHPRVFGQSLEDFKQSFKNAVNIDDYILQYCLKLIALENNVILLTDDINLCNKSMVNHLSVFTKKEFQRIFALTEK